MFTSLTETPVFNYRQGHWVHVKYNDQCHLVVVQNVNCTENLVNIRCLKHHSDSWWKPEPEIDAVWYIESDILGHAEHEPVMDQRGASYKPSKQRLIKQNKFETFLKAVLQLFL